MRKVALILGALAVLNLASAQQPNVAAPSGAKVIGSSSGQFYVSTRGPLSPQTLDLAVKSDLLTLEPTLLAVSCDRIKSELLRQLNMPDQWRGKIFVHLHPVRSVDEPITVVSERFAGNWQCIVELPDAIDRNRLVEAIVRGTLLEIANRNAHGRPPKFPNGSSAG